MLKTISNYVATASYIILGVWFFLCVLHPCVQCAATFVLAIAAAAFAVYARRGF